MILIICAHTTNSHHCYRDMKRIKNKNYIMDENDPLSE